LGGGGLVVSGTTAPGAGASATSTNAIAIGAGNLTFAGASATTANSVAIGGASSTLAGAVADQAESISIGVGATLNATASSVQLGRATNTSVGVLRYRSQIIAQESWSDTFTSPAYINATGNFVKGGTPVLQVETLANTNENSATTPSPSIAVTFVTTSPAATLTNTATATGAAGTFLGFSTSVATDGIYTAVYGNPGVNNVPTYPPTGGTNGSIAFKAGPGTTFTSFTITDPTIASTDLYGYSVAISSNGLTLAVGAPGVSTSAGAIYIWQRASVQTAGWGSSVRTLSGAASDRLGYSVAFSADGSTLVSGAPGASTAAAGKIYVYARNADGLWASAPTTEVNGTALGTTTTMLGYRVGISGDGDTIVIGSFVSAASPGTAYFSTRSSGTWASATALTPTSPTNSDGHGRGVAISQDANTIAVGATLTAVTNKVTIWQRSGSTYPTVGQSIAGTASTNFGTSIALSADGLRLLVGAPATSSNVGSALDYHRATTGTSAATIAFTASRTAVTGDGTASGNFGWTTSMSTDAAYSLIGTSLSAGRVFAENLNANGILAAGTVNGQTKKICASTFTALNSNTAKYDLFTIASAALTSICITSGNVDVYAIRFDNRGSSVDMVYDTTSSKWIIQGGAGITTV
jgi:hypothetical protein